MPRLRVAYEAEIARAVQRVVVEELMALAASADMPQVRAIATLKLEEAQEAAREHGKRGGRRPWRRTPRCSRATSRGSSTTPTRSSVPRAIVVPPGAPIGDPGMDWLGLAEPPCSLWDIAPGGVIRR